MSKIVRNIESSLKTSYDLIIIGGGIYGIMLALEAGFRGKSALLLERDDFGGATSYNHLRTLHGGLRYLQSMDLTRFIESVQERKWFLTHFPQLCEVLPCLMPLYGKGLRRNPILNAALFMNDILSRKRNAAVNPGRHIPEGRVISAEETKRVFPKVNPDGLKGSALWYDGAMPENQRLSIEILLWACGMGATALNYVRVDRLINNNNSIAGIKAVDRESGNELEFKSPVVINAAGPWCRDIAMEFDRDYPALFKKRILNWNILFKRKALSDHALALTPYKGAGHTYFFHNWKNRMLIGTGEEPIADSCSDIFPAEEQISSFIWDLNMAVPGLSLTMDDIEHIYCGVLPGTDKGKLSKRELIIDHGNNGGPKGLFSVSGVKFTTSRLVAEKTLNQIYPDTVSKTSRFAEASFKSGNNLAAFSYDWLPSDDNQGWLRTLKQLIENEAVVHIDDLLFRRTSLGENRRRVSKLLPLIRDLFTWSDSRWEQEIDRLAS